MGTYTLVMMGPELGRRLARRLAHVRMANLFIAAKQLAQGRLESGFPALRPVHGSPGRGRVRFAVCECGLLWQGSGCVLLPVTGVGAGWVVHRCVEWPLPMVTWPLFMVTVGLKRIGRRIVKVTVIAATRGGHSGAGISHGKLVVGAFRERDGYRARNVTPNRPMTGAWPGKGGHTGGRLPGHAVTRLRGFDALSAEGGGRGEG